MIAPAGSALTPDIEPTRGRWDEAEALLTELAAVAPGVKIYRIYRERIAQFRVSPPAADWDGIFGFTAR